MAESLTKHSLSTIANLGLDIDLDRLRAETDKLGLINLQTLNLQMDLDYVTITKN